MSGNLGVNGLAINSLNAGISGLLVAQKGLNTISQNITNVNTPGYVRKKMIPESVSVDGAGAGVAAATIQRSVDEGLMRDIRRQNSAQGNLDTLHDYYPRVQDLFGQVGDNNSISHQMEVLQISFESLANQVSTSALQTAAVQTGLDTANKLSQMTESIQALRLEADRALQETIGQVNEQLSNIYDLNEKIVRGSLNGADIGELQDKRDIALSTLAKYMDITYFQRGDNSIGVFSNTGKTLVDKSHATLNHIATTVTSSWMTRAGGNFNSITISTSSTVGADISDEFKGGKIKALLDLRDDILTNLQSQVDEMSNAMKNNINLVHNRGTSYPTSRSTMTGSRRLIDPNNPDVNDPTAPATIPAALQASPQKIWMSSGDTAITLFDPDGNEIATSTIKTIMSDAAYNDAAGTATSLDISATPGVKFTDVAAKIQNWMRAQSYQNNQLSSATASVTNGVLELNTSNTSVNLAFRDQTATAKGSAAGDATIKFDVDGDGNADESVSGFSNFFGLNDFFTESSPNSMSSSVILPSNFTINSTRTFSLYDPSGQIGNSITVPAGSTLESIAAAINSKTKTSESSILATDAVTLGSNATVTISDSNGNITGFPLNLSAASINNLADIAAAIDALGGSVLAKVVQSAPNNYQLRVWDSRGVPLSISFSGGTVGSTNLDSYLSMREANLIDATVIPDGSGKRLRIRQNNDKELFIGAIPDSQTPPGSIITDLSLHAAATGSAGSLSVRADLQTSPSLISRGAVQYNADLDKYYLSEGDNSIVSVMAQTMSDKIAMSSAGDIYAGSYSFAEYAAATISVVSTNASHSEDLRAYQTSLNQALNNQYSSFSGVNLDEEVANMILFQQAYNASAKVISTLKDMLDTLVNIIR